MEMLYFMYPFPIVFYILALDIKFWVVLRHNFLNIIPLFLLFLFVMTDWKIWQIFNMDMEDVGFAVVLGVSMCITAIYIESLIVRLGKNKKFLSNKSIKLLIQGVFLFLYAKVYTYMFWQVVMET